jgi:hypothetical protein
MSLSSATRHANGYYYIYIYYIFLDIDSLGYGYELDIQHISDTNRILDEYGYEYGYISYIK